MDTGALPLAAFILTAIGWISREIWRWRKAKRLASEDATKTLNQKKKLLEDMILKVKDANSKQILLTQLGEVNAALLGLYAERLRHTLKDAGLPTEETLIADGWSQLKPQQATNLREVAAEVKALSPVSVQDLFILGNAYYYMDQYQDAKNTYDVILNLNPDDAIALNNRSIIYSVIGKRNDALSDLNLALKLKPDNPDFIFNRGKLYGYMGKHIESLADLNHSLELRPDDPDILTNRGATYHNLKEYKKALSDYNRSLELRPDDALTLSNRGVTYKELGKHDKALADYNRSLELRPNYYYALINRGTLYKDLGKHDKALADYIHALESEPSDSRILYNLARLFSIQGKTSEALDFLRRVIDKEKRFDKVAAKRNRDFDNIRDDPRFKKLIEPD